MTKASHNPNTSYQVTPIGYVQRNEQGKSIHILAPFRPALKQLEHFSHVIVLWWADQHDNKESRGMLQCRPPYAEDVLTGVFATRAEYRPNPIGLTTSKLLEVDETNGVVRLGDIDAFDGTPVLDLKAYFPVCDRVQNASIPGWLDFGMEWMPDEGLGLFEESEYAE
ncbi:MAG: tRNA (N6-threonylcarbamoyladenosine(37)-N6)-methyltransferase TrmO [Anaerolineales bacterium]|nr:tRNA (N6-threonylcarbamoyladenosine(37)-N6)-methyltransferase TrmO [Anaerolineales bacterium]